MAEALKMENGYELKSQSKLNDCPALPLCVRGWGELISQGYVQGAICLAWDHSPFWIEYKGEPVAVLTWTYQEFRAQVWIDFVHVDPAHRRKGLYRAMYAAVQAVAREKKCLSIAGGISTANKRMQKTAEAVGRRAEYVVYYERLS